MEVLDTSVAAVILPHIAGSLSATTISGVDSIDVLRQNLEVARNFEPLTPAEMKALRDRCRDAAADGHLELLKTSTMYDGAEGRRQHQYSDVEKLPA
jgi:hypothetical protein